jgi:Holliday junction resolvase-like predicted endonuclease
LKVTKSSRHSKITGDFTESLVLYWLSKYGFECAKVDHTGIDIIARNPHSDEVMGISVKSRSRSRGTESSSLSITSDNFAKVGEACTAFDCSPYFAIVVDADDTINCWILTMDHLLALHPAGGAASSWSMRPRWLDSYESDPQIMHFTMVTNTANWWSDALT